MTPTLPARARNCLLYLSWVWHWLINMIDKISIPPASTPMCDEARAIHSFKQRVAHYRACMDPRCQARLEATRVIAVALAKAVRQNFRSR